MRCRLPYRPPGRRGGQRGSALVLTIVFGGISLLLLGAAISWSSTNANLVQRHIALYDALSAAEAATEKVLASMAHDYQTQGEWAVTNNLPSYRSMVPTTNESSQWANFEFSDGQGNVGSCYVGGANRWAYQSLNSQFTGLYGSACGYRIIANARPLGSGPTNLMAALEQDIQIASIPVFQFAVFYSVDLEINPGANMRITGRVHSNQTIYTQPNGSTWLTFGSGVTAVGNIIANDAPGDPSNRGSTYNVTYQGLKQSKVSSLVLPIGVNNTPAAVHAILEVPPSSEDPNSPMGQQRYYNKADLVILVSNNTVTATSGAFDNFATSIGADWTNFVSTNVTFFNKRENMTVKTTQVDIGRLATWSANNSTLRRVLGRDVRVLYVADFRSQSGSTEAGVRVVNGQTLLPLGLTVATPDPLYVQGHYNAPTAYQGTTNTTTTVPASLLGDAITLLSSSWSDANSSKTISYRTAGNTTVNAAFVSGNVPTGGGSYSGGLENFPRFLENWGGKTLTYNGSMVMMFSSQIAKAPWGGSDVYSPPNRNWAFDLNFTDATKLPPGTPEVRAIVRGSWSRITPNTIPPAS